MVSLLPASGRSFSVLAFSRTKRAERRWLNVVGARRAASATRLVSVLLRWPALDDCRLSRPFAPLTFTRLLFALAKGGWDKGLHSAGCGAGGPEEERRRRLTKERGYMMEGRMKRGMGEERRGEQKGGGGWTRRGPSSAIPTRRPLLTLGGREADGARRLFDRLRIAAFIDDSLGDGETAVR